MKIGTVISEENGLYVVTQIENGHATATERLEDFIARSVVVKYDNEFRTLKEIIDLHCDRYLSTHQIKC